MKRIGLGKGRGKGYKNLQGSDKIIHSQSAKGIKQPQRIKKIMTRPPLPPNPIGKLLGKNVIIKGKRWFEKTNGNTYHSVEVYVDGEMIGRKDFVYGYGDQYLESGKKILIEKGYVNYEKTTKNIPVKDFEGNIKHYTSLEARNKRNALSKLSEAVRDKKIKWVNFVDDVSRKKDL